MRSSAEWTTARVRGVCRLTPTVLEIVLEPDGGARPSMPGAHVDVEVTIGGAPAIRSYSLVGRPDPVSYRIAVKRVAASRGGSVFMIGLNAGDRLRVSAPKNHFELRRDASEYLLVAGGIGITPISGMALELKRRGVRFRLVYGARSAEELAYGEWLRDELGELLEVFLDGDGHSVNAAREVARLDLLGEAYVCGPAPMLRAFREAWQGGGRATERLRFETFGSGGYHPSEPFRVRVPRHDVDLLVGADETLLDALRRAGVEVLFDCLRGECGLCTVDVLAANGEIDHRDVFLGEEERKAGKRMCACVSRIVAGGVVLDSAFRPDGVEPRLDVSDERDLFFRECSSRV